MGISWNYVLFKILLFFSTNLQNLLKNREKEISTSVWSAQHLKPGKNIQHQRRQKRSRKKICPMQSNSKDCFGSIKNDVINNCSLDVYFDQGVLHTPNAGRNMLCSQFLHAKLKKKQKEEKIRLKSGVFWYAPKWCCGKYTDFIQKYFLTNAACSYWNKTLNQRLGASPQNKFFAFFRLIFQSFCSFFTFFIWKT